MLALETLVGLGLLHNSPLSISVLYSAPVLSDPTFHQVCQNIIQPSNAWSFFSSFGMYPSIQHFLSYPAFYHSLHMFQPSYSLGFKKFYSVSSLYFHITIQYMLVFPYSTISSSPLPPSLAHKFFT